MAERIMPNQRPNQPAGGAKAPPKADPQADGENAPVEGKRPQGAPEDVQKPEAPEAPAIPKGTKPILSSPRDFGVHINGLLHRFKKGRTPLTEEQHDALSIDPYVADNGAEITYK